jgi:hypothetical protein
MLHFFSIGAAKYRQFDVLPGRAPGCTGSAGSLYRLVGWPKTNVVIQSNFSICLDERFCGLFFFFGAFHQMRRGTVVEQKMRSRFEPGQSVLDKVDPGWCVYNGCTTSLLHGSWLCKSA